MGEFEMLNWKTNPFTFRITPELFVGYENETKRVINSIKSGEKFTMIIGPTGSGKTTMIKHIINKLSDTHKIIYLPKPPKDPNDFVKVFEVITKGLFSFFRNDGINLYNLSNKVNSKLGERSCIIFVDEGHEASIESLEWLRTITDQVDNLSTVIAGLPVIESLMKEKLETFSRRIVNTVRLTNLSKHELRELIKRRVESVGGDDIRPFTGEVIDFVFERTGGFPRDALKLCNELVQEALANNMTTIDLGFVMERNRMEPKMKVETITELPDRQKEIVEAIGNRQLTPSEIVSAIKSESYKNRDNAVRSVNNLLRRLMADGIVERKKIGKTYKYYIRSKYETLMVKA